MGQFRDFRRISYGLVIILIFFSTCCSYAQGANPPADKFNTAGSVAGFEGIRLEPGVLKDWNEIKVSGKRKVYKNRLSLLFFLPGPLFLLGMVVLRKPLKFPFFILILLLLGASENNPELLVSRAEQSFLCGEIQEALTLYTQVESCLTDNSAVQYNLALLSCCLEQPGRAIYYLRKSLVLKPEDAEARDMLNKLEQHYELEGQIPTIPPVNPDLFYLATLVLANLAFILSAFLYRTRQVKALILVILLSALTLSSLGVFVSFVQQQKRHIGIVAPHSAELKKIPLDTACAWIELKGGTTLAVLGEAEGFYLVETGFELKGWIRKEFILY